MLAASLCPVTAISVTDSTLARPVPSVVPTQATSAVPGYAAPYSRSAAVPPAAAPALLTAQCSYTSSEAPASSCGAAVLDNDMHATLSVGGRGSAHMGSTREVIPGRTTSAGINLAAQLETIQAQIAALAKEVRGVHAQTAAIGQARILQSKVHRPCSAPMQPPVAPSPTPRKRPPMSK